VRILCRVMKVSRSADYTYRISDGHKETETAENVKAIFLWNRVRFVSARNRTQIRSAIRDPSLTNFKKASRKNRQNLIISGLGEIKPKNGISLVSTYHEIHANSFNKGCSTKIQTAANATQGTRFARLHGRVSGQRVIGQFQLGCFQT
jgi:hypothetical protein